MLITLIKQGGLTRCPVCKKSIKWTFKLEHVLPENTSSLNGIATAIECTPHNYITYIAKDNGKVRFIVPCENCRSNIETSDMELINETNYISNKN